MALIHAKMFVALCHVISMSGWLAMSSSDGSRSGISLQEQLAKYSTELARLRSTLNLAFGIGAHSSNADEDRVVFPFGVSCRDIFEEIVAAVERGHGRSALRTARTMYECVVFSRHIHVHPEKANLFLNKFYEQWAKIVQNLPDRPENMPEMHKALSQRVPKYDGGKRISVQDLN